MRFYIKTDHGFFKDNGLQDNKMLNSFVYGRSDAQFFNNVHSAGIVLQALFRKGIEGEILTEGRQMENDAALHQIARETAAEAARMIQEHPTTETIQIVVVEPNKRPYKTVVPNTIEAFNKIVQGHIEYMYMGEIRKGVRLGLIINEEGKILQLPFNRKIIDVDTLVGTFIVTAYNLLGDNISLTDKQADFLITRFTDLEVEI